MRTSPTYVSAVLMSALALSPLVRAQQQAPNARAGWPCGARIDPAYFHLAEATGGHLLLLAPEEIGNSGSLLATLDEHKETIFRLAGAMNAGVHEFHVPIDPSVESVLFSISVQCLQVAEVRGPDGTPAGGADVTDLSNFRALRVVMARRPEPGVWTIRVAGTGIAGVMVQARSGIAIAEVAFAPAGSSAFTRLPSPGMENIVRIRLTGRPAAATSSLVDGAFRRIAALPLAAGDTDASYVARFTAGAGGFRILVEGKDPQGFPFQRLYAPLFTTGG